MLTAALVHLQQARTLEAEGRLDEALREYRKASEYDPSNRSIASRAAELDRELREKIEASRPRPPIEQLREQARRSAQEPTLNPASRDPLNLRFANTSLRDLLNFIGSATGINITYDRDFQDRSVTVQLEGVTLEQALQQVMLSNQIFYKVLNERTIIVATDNTAKRAAVRGAGHQDVLRLARRRHRAGAAGQHRDPGAADGHPAAHRPEQDRQHHHGARVGAGGGDHRADHQDQRQAAGRGGHRRPDPRGEPRARQALRPEPHRLRARRASSRPSSAPGSTVRRAGGERRPRPPAAARRRPTSARRRSSTPTRSPPASAPPTSTWRCRRRSSASSRATRRPRWWPSRSCAAQEGQKVTLNLGEDVPVPSTTFTPLAQGGAAANPLTSFTYRPIGVIVEMTPRVTYEGDIVMDLIAGEQRPRPGLDHRRADPAGLRLAQGDHPPAAARRRVEPARRAAARGRAPVAARVSRASCACRSCSSCSPTTTPTSARPTS